MGLTLVHVNRVLQRLRARGLITLRNKHLVINDAQALKEFGQFDPNYLHLREKDWRSWALLRTIYSGPFISRKPQDKEDALALVSHR